MIKPEAAYNVWAEQYDTNHNRTRDLEAVSLRETLAGKRFARVLEIGCGTGKNTQWLETISNEITAADISAEMLAKAEEKVKTGNVSFHQADIKADWSFAVGKFDLITFSLVLEHIEDINSIVAKAAALLQPGGYIYIGELHPFKQYNGTKARFDTVEGRQIVECYNHHMSDFTQAALHSGLSIIIFNEYFDDDDRNTLPRILTLLLQKPAAV